MSFSMPELQTAGGGGDGGSGGGNGGDGNAGGEGGPAQTSHALHLHTGRSTQLYCTLFSHHA